MKVVVSVWHFRDLHIMKPVQEEQLCIDTRLENRTYMVFLDILTSGNSLREIRADLRRKLCGQAQKLPQRRLRRIVNRDDDVVNDNEY